MRTVGIVTENILSERFHRTLHVRTRFFDKETIVFQVCDEELSLTRKFATRWSIGTINDEFVYHLRGRIRKRSEGIKRAQTWRMIGLLGAIFLGESGERSIGQ
jgi:hypothetical protein